MRVLTPTEFLSSITVIELGPTHTQLLRIIESSLVYCINHSNFVFRMQISYTILVLVSKILLVDSTGTASLNHN